MNSVKTYPEADLETLLSPARSTGYFMMDNFLQSRIEACFPTNDEFYDEDINVYIAGVLESVSEPRRQESQARLVVPRDQDLNRVVERIRNHWKKYWVYRANADFLFISLGIFDNPTRSRKDSISHMNLSRGCYLGRAKTYYRLAQSHLLQSTRRNTPLGETLGKLSERLEDYVRVLSFMKGEYLNLFHRLSDGEIYHLQLSAAWQDEETDISGLKDRFLDLYTEYRAGGRAGCAEELEKVAGMIRSIDSSFVFSLEREKQVKDSGDR